MVFTLHVQVCKIVASGTQFKPDSELRYFINPKWKRCDLWWDGNVITITSVRWAVQIIIPAKLLWQAWAQSSCYLFFTLKLWKEVRGTWDRCPKRNKPSALHPSAEVQTSPGGCCAFALLTKAKRGLGKISVSLSLCPQWWHNFKEMFMKWRIRTVLLFSSAVEGYYV